MFDWVNNVIGWIIGGLIVGWIAGRIYGEGRPEGCITNTVVGVGGALLGGAIYSLVTGNDFTQGFDWESMILAVGGSLSLIFILARMSRSR